MTFSCFCFSFFAVNILRDLVATGSFVCICIIVSLSKNNPFKSHIIGEIDRYYSEILSNNDSYLFKNSLYDNITINETLLNDNIFNDTDNLLNKNSIENINNISPSIFNYKIIFKRKLESDSFCADIYDSFKRNNGKKLSYIFDLNYETIYGISIALLIVTLINIILVSTIWIMLIFSYKMTGLIPQIIGAVIILFWIAKFILFLLLFHFIEKSDIEKYDDFLDCRHVRKSYFKKFNNIEKFRKCFIGFTVFNLLSEIFDKINNLFEACIEGPKLVKKINPSVLSSSTDNIK